MGKPATNQGEPSIAISTEYPLRFSCAISKTCAPQGSVERVLQLAEETRTVAELSDTSKWSTYAQYRRLLEAAGEVLGAPAACHWSGSGQ